MSANRVRVITARTVPCCLTWAAGRPRADTGDHRAPQPLDVARDAQRLGLRGRLSLLRLPPAPPPREASYTGQRTDHILYPYLLMDAIWDNADRFSVDYEAPALGSWVTGVKTQAY